MRVEHPRAAGHLDERLARYPLLDALLERRSRRFAPGMRLNGGPLAYASARPPRALTRDEEAALAFAACGVTGYALGELPYDAGDLPEAGGGNIMVHFAARTVASGDAVHATAVFVMNDEGTWLLRRPQDFPRTEVADLVRAARERRFGELYERSRVRVADRRVDVPREVAYVPGFNHWSANRPGTTYYLPVAELSALCINMMLAAFGDDLAAYALDERNRYRPAGVARFARSRGGHLHDDPAENRITTVGTVEQWLCEFAASEQGGILQNLGLMTQALGLGGFPHFAAHPYAWFPALGFRMTDVPFSRTIGAGPLTAALLRALRRDPPVPTPLGLERDGAPLLKPFCPPYYRSMEDAVLAFVGYKYAQGRGTLRDGGAATAWRDGAAVQAAIPPYSERAVEATIAYCEYVYRRYGRFPATTGPFRTVLAYQASWLDLDFYERFYRPEALSDTHRRHQAV